MFAGCGSSSEYANCAVIAVPLLESADPPLPSLFIGLEFEYPLFLPLDADEFGGGMIRLVNSVRRELLLDLAREVEKNPVLITLPSVATSLPVQTAFCSQFLKATEARDSRNTDHQDRGRRKFGHTPDHTSSSAFPLSSSSSSSSSSSVVSSSGLSGDLPQGFRLGGMGAMAGPTLQQVPSVA
jgi:hypothetical protein